MAFWMSRRSFEIDLLVRAPLDVVRAQFVEPTRWLRSHPLITDVVPRPGEPGGYDIHEIVRFLGVNVNNKYRVRIAVHEDGVDSEAWSSPAISIQSRLAWRADGDGTRIHEETVIDVPLPVASFVQRTARRAHEDQLGRLRDEIEGASQV
ncbi:MAG: SRPBCC family protein [Polyangiaceae bacterium]